MRLSVALGRRGWLRRRVRVKSRRSPAPAGGGRPVGDNADEPAVRARSAQALVWGRVVRAAQELHGEPGPQVSEQVLATAASVMIHLQDLLPDGTDPGAELMDSVLPADAVRVLLDVVLRRELWAELGGGRDARELLAVAAGETTAAVRQLAAPRAVWAVPVGPRRAAPLALTSGPALRSESVDSPDSSDLSGGLS